MSVEDVNTARMAVNTFKSINIETYEEIETETLENMRSELLGVVREMYSVIKSRKESKYRK